MNRPAAAALFALVLTTLSGCGDESATGITTAAPRPMDTSGATSTTAVEAIPLGDLFGDRLPLFPGTYETQLTARPVRVTLGDGWYFTFQAPWSVALARQPAGPTGDFGLESFDVDILSEVSLPDDPLAGEAGRDGVILTPFTGEVDYVDWLAAIPGVTVTDRHPVRVAGMDGVGFEMEVAGLPARSQCGNQRCVGLWEATGFYGLLAEGDAVRAYVVGEGMDQVFITYSRSGDDFEAMAESVVESLEIG